MAEQQQQGGLFGQGIETLSPLRFPHPERFDGTESNFEEFAVIYGRI